MSMSALVRALGAAAGGVSSGMDAAEAAAERKRLRDEAVEDRKFTMSERTRALNLRDELGRAAATVAPVEIKQDRPDSMDDRDVGGAGEAPLPTAGYDVAGKRFATKDEAMTAAAAANTPQAVTTRMSDVLMRNGDPVQAQKLRVGAMQEQVGKFQLNDAMRADLDAQWNQEVDNKVTDWKTMAQFYSDSAADGVGGKNKYQFLPSPDGKSQVAHLVLADGALKPTEKTFPNTADGFAVAKAEMKRMPAERVLMHFFQKNQLAQQAERDAATAKYHEGMLKISQQNADTNEQYRRDQAAALKAKGGAGAAPIWDDKADTFLRERYTSKNPETGASVVDGDGLVFAKQIALAAARDKFGGDTTSALGYAFDIDKKIAADAGNDPAKIRAGRQKLLGALFAGPTTTRPANKAETISEDVKATNPSGYLVDINGTRNAYGTAKMSDFVNSAVGAKGQAGRAPADNTPAATQAATQAAAPDGDPPEGRALDAATAARAAAEQELRKWGQAQRARDPQGFAAAVAKRDAAAQQEAEAKRAWQALVANEAPAFARMQTVTAKR